jgi:hypothetical protein
LPARAGLEGRSAIFARAECLLVRVTCSDVRHTEQRRKQKNKQASIVSATLQACLNWHEFCLTRLPTIKTSEAHMGEWEFFRIPGSTLEGPPFLWSWRCRNADGTELTTPDRFRFLLDCVAHARLHGYSGGPLQTQRDPGHGGRWRAVPALRAAS